MTTYFPSVPRRQRAKPKPVYAPVQVDRKICLTCGCRRMLRSYPAELDGTLAEVCRYCAKRSVRARTFATNRGVVTPISIAEEPTMTQIWAERKHARLSWDEYVWLSGRAGQWLYDTPPDMPKTSEQWRVWASWVWSISPRPNADTYMSTLRGRLAAEDWLRLIQSNPQNISRAAMTLGNKPYKRMLALARLMDEKVQGYGL